MCLVGVLRMGLWQAGALCGRAAHCPGGGCGLRLLETGRPSSPTQRLALIKAPAFSHTSLAVSEARITHMVNQGVTCRVSINYQGWAQKCTAVSVQCV